MTETTAEQPTGRLLPRRVAVIGGGRMGSGIAHAFAVGGSSVIVLERDDASAASGLERVRDAIRASERRGTLRADDTLDEALARVSATTERAELAESELVVEAVPEDETLKRETLEGLAAVLSDRAIIASNTSSLSISALASTLPNPARFLGLHFFNPVPASALVEIVVGRETSPEIVTAAQSWVEALGKTPITVQDVPGFASSRLGVVIALEAIRMLESGVASAEDIDAAMVLGYRFPVGPLKLTDMVGLDVRLGIAEYLHQELGARFEPPVLMRQMVAEGKLGRKSGQGFFEWPTE